MGSLPFDCGVLVFLGPINGPLWIALNQRSAELENWLIRIGSALSVVGISRCLLGIVNAMKKALSVTSQFIEPLADLDHG